MCTFTVPGMFTLKYLSGMVQRDVATHALRLPVGMLTSVPR